MALLYDGDRVFDASTTTRWSQANVNSIQDLLILGLAERTIQLPLERAFEGVNWDFGATWYRHIHAAENDLWIPVIFAPEDVRITELYCAILNPSPYPV